jgi:hypothetical protein
MNIRRSAHRARYQLPKDTGKRGFWSNSKSDLISCGKQLVSGYPQAVVCIVRACGNQLFPACTLGLKERNGRSGPK